MPDKYSTQLSYNFSKINGQYQSQRTVLQRRQRSLGGLPEQRDYAVELLSWINCDEWKHQLYRFFFIIQLVCTSDRKLLTPNDVLQVCSSRECL